MKELTLSEILAFPANSPLWVLNTTNSSEVAQAGELLIPVPRRHGNGSDVIAVPMSWLPYDLTMDAERELIVNASEFRKALHNGNLVVIPQEEADKLLGDSEARGERKRLLDKKRQIDIAHAKAISGGDKEESGKPATNPERAKRDPNLGPNEIQPGITHQFKAWVERLNLLADDSVKSEIRLRRNFTFKELRFAMAGLNNKPQAQNALQDILHAKKAKKAAKGGK
ncbi:hypothetical protein [Achromobacter phage Motura]|uniref:Uncharacterized protein n=1 Tax=Achromobacter phage Motura TaxID=2591403 RepID=A0A514CSK6_9CAUD|nr:hypothetical protein H1O15_gp042 [Achromobacter phage Motura]QDH83450.1 hypothetical protein [Achromobacter phage Motura]